MVEFIRARPRVRRATVRGRELGRVPPEVMSSAGRFDAMVAEVDGGKDRKWEGLRCFKSDNLLACPLGRGPQIVTDSKYDNAQHKHSLHKLHCSLS